jgi:glycosyltransferase involved in cell wall biosynthesis
MLHHKRIVLVMPAYNAGNTLEKTYAEIPHDLVDHIILVDDCSRDDTVKVARSLGIEVLTHSANKGYGGNQKSCYALALERGADVAVMLHPDYQYTPLLVAAMVSPIANGVYDCMLASRILGKGALQGGMPHYKYVCNRVLTLAQNLLVGHQLSEYHTGYRAFSRAVLEALPLHLNSDDFVFDNQMLCQIIHGGFRIGELSCPTLYADDSSSIRFWPAVRYGFGVLGTSLELVAHRLHVRKSNRFAPLDDRTAGCRRWRWQ